MKNIDIDEVIEAFIAAAIQADRSGQDCVVYQDVDTEDIGYESMIKLVADYKAGMSNHNVLVDVPATLVNEHGTLSDFMEWAEGEGRREVANQVSASHRIY